MYLSSCIWALTGAEEENLRHMSTLGFQWIDVQPQMLAAEKSQALARDLQLNVSSVGASFAMREGEALDSADPHKREAALARLDQSYARAAALGATAVYVVPGKDGSRQALVRYASSLAQAANGAAAHGLSLCIEHFPGTALPTAAETLAFIRDIGHPALHLLLDSGHLQMSDEDPGTVIAAAGPSLGYVHLDDNDGEGDLHWSLLDGVMTEVSLKRTFAALAEIGYAGAVSLELSPLLPDPLAAQRRSREIVLDIAAAYLD